MRHVLPFRELTLDHVPEVGGKNASLGELIRTLVPKGIRVPDGFAITAEAYRLHLRAAGLDPRIYDELSGLDVRDLAALSRTAGRIRDAIRAAPLPKSLEEEILAAYAALSRASGEDATDVAVRSSATAEDLPSASFAGQQESYLNVRGERHLLTSVRDCMASLFTDRAIVYRAERGFAERGVGLSVGVQKMVRSDLGAAGVIFTLDTESGFRDVLLVTGAYGLGESVVKGRVDPDEIVVHKPTLAKGYRAIVRRERGSKATRLVYASGGNQSVVEERVPNAQRESLVLSDDDTLTLARWAVAIEEHYGERHGRPTPMDIEWAKDGRTGDLYVVQARPETVHANATSTTLELFRMRGKGRVLASGKSVGARVGTGRARIIRSAAELSSFQAGEVLVAPVTDPDWEPVLKLAGAVVTDHGGRTCHAAIVSRELGIPCIVGTTDATAVLENGREVTVDATRGVVTAGRAQMAAAPTTTPASVVAAAPPVTATKLLVNLSEPSQVDRVKDLPVEGVGLLRAELMLLEALDGTHPLALIEAGEGEQVVERMAAALERFATGFAPRPITYRTIDFRTNEFRGLRGGERFEPVEANPMLGFRGAYRYTKQPQLLELELQAIARVCDGGADNLHVMLPFVRTERELRRCIEIIERSGLPGRRGYELWIMAEVPSVLFNLERYAALGITGISIGSNDLTQLLLGVDRDSELLAELFDARDPAVLDYLRKLIPAARALGLKTSICGQAPSLHPEYAEVLVRAGIDAVSVTPDAVDRTRRLLGAAEQLLLLEGARAAATR